MSEVFMEAGYDVKKSEVHGMAMRGGIVTSHFRFGKKVYSPSSRKGRWISSLPSNNWRDSDGSTI
jgi:indolepyruvate ferredoxin oxidoreductase beta subunit